MPRHPITRPRWVPVVLAVVTALLATACRLDPAAATDVPIHHSLFGVHDGSMLASGAIGEGSVRLWDVGVQWRDIETSPGHYNWARLDQLVSDAQAHHLEVTMVVAMTPSFYAQSPTDPPRKLWHYSRFVRALMHRYRDFHGSRGIAAYQVWNEANIATFWTGSVTALARLTRAMDQARNRVDPHAKVIAPAMVTRLPYQLDGLASYYRTRLQGVPVWRYVDAVALSLYPLPTTGRRLSVPEDSIRQLLHVRRILARAGVPGRKPIWDTEINYGLQTGKLGGTAAKRISDVRQASNVVRTYLLNAANGVRRVFWYRYDWGLLSGGGTLGDTLLSSPTDPHQVTAAGRAYLRAQAWMHGTLIGSRGHRPCAKDRHGTYTCVVKDATGVRRIYWNPFATGHVRLARTAHHLTGVLGAVTTVQPGSTITVGPKPVMASR